MHVKHEEVSAFGGRISLSVMSSARPPRAIGLSAFLICLSAGNRLNGPKESTSLGCELRRSFIRVVRAPAPDILIRLA
jgi:hypothetical protein